ncbi:hypothetical protein ACNQFZ_01560 [Schinkia sp. CFF1]
MLDDSGRTKRVNLIYLENEKMRRGFLVLQNNRKEKEAFPNELILIQAYKNRLMIEIKIKQHENEQATLRGRVFNIDRKNKKVLLIHGTTSHTKLCIPIPFAQIISVKIIHTKPQ